MASGEQDDYRGQRKTRIGTTQNTHTKKSLIFYQKHKDHIKGNAEGLALDGERVSDELPLVHAQLKLVTKHERAWSKKLGEGGWWELAALKKAFVSLFGKSWRSVEVSELTRERPFCLCFEERGVGVNGVCMKKNWGAVFYLLAPDLS